jgi:nitrogen regulatory protein PII 1
MIRSIIRPEKADAVLAALMDAGFPSVTKYAVAGRGKQRGIKIGDITYDELPKVMLMSVVQEHDKQFVIDTIMNTARSTGKGAFGDGKIFVTEVEESYTISSGVKDSTTEEISEASEEVSA